MEPPCLGLGVPTPHENTVSVLKACLLSEAAASSEPKASLLRWYLGN